MEGTCLVWGLGPSHLWGTAAALTWDAWKSLCNLWYVVLALCAWAQSAETGCRLKTAVAHCCFSQPKFPPGYAVPLSHCIVTSLCCTFSLFCPCVCNLVEREKAPLVAAFIWQLRCVGKRKTFHPSFLIREGCKYWQSKPPFSFQLWTARDQDCLLQTLISQQSKKAWKQLPLSNRHWPSSVKLFSCCHFKEWWVADCEVRRTLEHFSLP